MEKNCHHPTQPETPKTSVLTMSTLNQIPLLRDIIKDLFARAASLAMTRCCSLGVFPSRSRNWLHCTGRWIYSPFRWLSFSDIKLGQLGLPSWKKVCHTLWVHAQIRSTKLQKFHKSSSPLQHPLDASIIESQSNVFQYTLKFILASKTAQSVMEVPFTLDQTLTG